MIASVTVIFANQIHLYFSNKYLILYRLEILEIITCDHNTFDYNGSYQPLYKKTLVYKELNSSCEVFRINFSQ